MAFAVASEVLRANVNKYWAAIAALGIAILAFRWSLAS